MSEPALVSIMMPAYNAGAYIEQAVQSVLAQTYMHWELVVVDDGSSDDTAQRLAQFSDPRIRVLHQPNSGEAVARNAALDAVTGDYLAFLDADDAFLPEHLELTLGVLEQRTDLDGLYTDGYYINPDGEQLNPLSSQRRGPFEGSIFEELVRASDVFGPPVCVLLRRRQVMLQGLRFDPEIVIGPDWDFFTRFSEHTRFGYLADKTCLYRVHPASISLSTQASRRRADLVRCREKAMALAGFNQCTASVRSAVFYDLLLDLLPGQADYQQEVTQRQAFKELPPAQQARLLRLLAVQGLEIQQETKQTRYIGDWLRRAVQLNPVDWRARALLTAYSISPSVLRWGLSLRRRSSR